MALFRLVCINFQRYVPSLEKLMVKLLWMQFAIMLGVSVVSLHTAQSYGSSNAHEFCRGYSTTFTHVLMKMTTEEKENGKRAMFAAILLPQSFVALEFICYLVIYWSLSRTNQSLSNVVQKDVLKNRAKRNTITLTGQTITFIVEVLYGVLLQVLIHFGKVSGFLGPGDVPATAMVAMMAMVTASQVLSSPELRRFLRGFQFHSQG